jgi:hypothetical protein
VTRGTRTTLQPLLQQLAEQLERARREDEEEQYFRAADDWWRAYDLQAALERRNEAA